ncbi:unnamed protein product [Thlaspi arvense]|uniref:Uncharacterized protein n=1 Tax=Thlaspi arvense TaxID=13288 RepID=A0AAU9SBS5_THLAR|nr:unnamed protein product [Thlaspi arvense]
MMIREKGSHLSSFIFQQSAISNQQRESVSISMDVYEATGIVLSRIQSLDPANASKIMGLLLLQDHGEKEMIRLAFGPQNLLHSVIAKAKAELGLMGPTLNPHSLPFRCVSDDLESDLGFRWGHCSYFVRGFCNDGCNCKFPHGGVDETFHGACSPVMEKCNELLRPNSVPPRLAPQFTGGSRFPFSPEGANLQQSEAQRAVASMMGDDLHKLARWRPESIDLSAMASRQIYLTFPADSIFREEDVSNYFSTYGAVEDVRIPNQQKRMFGFVTFVYSETVKSILAKGNPHFVCDSRVLVKPYKEKGKVPDKYRSKMSIASCVDGRAFQDNIQDLLWKRRFEERVLELPSRRLMNLQLLDVKNHPNHPFDQILVSPRLGSLLLSHLCKSFLSGMPNNPIALCSRQLSEPSAGREGQWKRREMRVYLRFGLCSLEDRLPQSPFASPTHHFIENDAAEDINCWGTASPTTDSTLSVSFKSFSCQMPLTGMLPGSEGSTCRVGI